MLADNIDELLMLLLDLQYSLQNIYSGISQLRPMGRAEMVLISRYAQFLISTFLISTFFMANGCNLIPENTLMD